MLPIGRQSASGLSLLLSALRLSLSSLAHDWNGNPPSTPAPISRNKRGPFGEPPVGKGAPGVLSIWAISSRQPRFSHIPVRSGLPSAVFGAGALRSGCPFGSLGTPAVGERGHWAAAAEGRAAREE